MNHRRVWKIGGTHFDDQDDATGCGRAGERAVEHQANAAGNREREQVKEGLFDGSGRSTSNYCTMDVVANWGRTVDISRRDHHFNRINRSGDVFKRAQ